MRRTAIVATILCLLLAETTWAALSGEGMRAFYVWLQPIQSGSPRDVFKVLASAGGDYPPSTIGRITLRPGPGLRLVDADTVRLCHVSLAWRGAEDRKWYFHLRADGPRKTYLRALVRVDASKSQTDEMAMEMPINITNDAVVFGSPYETREETVRDGQRYRYAGEFLVPIDAPEDLANPDIVERAKPIRMPKATCPTCEKSGELPFVVFVRPNGKMRSTRFLEYAMGAEGATPRMIQSAREALHGWTFTPGRTRTKAITDFVVVRVVVDATGSEERPAFDQEPVPVTQVQPVYPTFAREAGITGVVVVHVHVGTDGRVEKADAIRPVVGLTESAVDAARQWTFKPALKNRQPVEAWVEILFAFPPKPLIEIRTMR